MDDDQNLFAIIYKPGPNWQENQQEQQQELDQHDGYIKHLRQNRKLKQGGRYGDKVHGAPVIEARDEAEARDVAARDPAVKSGVLEAVVLPWNIVFGTHRGI
jgi:uncharacterized protein YciI